MLHLILLLVAGGLIYLVWNAAQPPWTVKVVAVPGDPVEIHGGPQAQLWRIEEFFERDVTLPGRVVVYAFREDGGRVRVTVRGKLDRGLQQRIRNLFHDIL